MNTQIVVLSMISPFVIAGCAEPPQTAQNGVQIFDLTHQLTTFAPKPMKDSADRFAPDLTKPIGGSKVVAGFSDQMILIHDPDFKTGDGVFKLNTTVIGENLGTSIDAGAHFVPNDPRYPVDQRTLAELSVEDLTGPVVFIDISERVAAELSSNNGTPGAVDITDFSVASGNVVTVADIESVANQLSDGAFLIAHTGWSEFYWQSGPGLEGPYVNGFNYPGFSRTAVERLIEIEEERGLRINGIGADNLTVDAGEAAGAPNFGQGAFPAHQMGLARGWKMLENLANTSVLDQGDCTLFVGAMNHNGGAAGWARVFARCEIIP